MDALVFKMQTFVIFLYILHFAESQFILRTDGKTRGHI